MASARPASETAAASHASALRAFAGSRPAAMLPTNGSASSATRSASFVNRLLANLHGQHRDGAAVETLDRIADRLAAPVLRQHVEEGKVMIRRRRRQHRVPAERFVVDERRKIAGAHGAARHGFEAYRPVIGLNRMTAPRIGMQ